MLKFSKFLRRDVSFMYVGFIGYGSMGSMLIKNFISKKALYPKDIVVSTRTKSKLEDLKKEYPEINIAENNIDLASKSKYIFICVKQTEVKGVLTEIKDILNEEKHIISLAGAVTIKNIEKVFNGKISKITPTIISEIGEGITLICHNCKVEDEDKKFIESLLLKIGRVKRIDEEDFALAVELTSCAPGFFASIFEEFMKSALRHNRSLREEEIKEMILYTIYGTSKLFIDKNITFNEVIDRVATKGGITEEGVKVLREKLPNIFDELFERTMNKRKMIKEKADELFQ
jgi:pyrroline-5-carboxylate reductase